MFRQIGPWRPETRTADWRDCLARRRSAEGRDVSEPKPGAGARQSSLPESVLEIVRERARSRGPLSEEVRKRVVVLVLTQKASRKEVPFTVELMLNDAAVGLASGAIRRPFPPSVDGLHAPDQSATSTQSPSPASVATSDDPVRVVSVGRRPRAERRTPARAGKTWMAPYANPAALSIQAVRLVSGAGHQQPIEDRGTGRGQPPDMENTSARSEDRGLRPRAPGSRDR